MLQDLFLALLGFPGDILVEEDSTIRVKDGFDLLTQAEREQINRISPLGWYYLRLQSFVDEYDMKWGGRSKGRQFQAYRTAMSLGVSDLLNEYTSDIAYLEQVVISDGPMPLSQVLLHMQKYIMSMPAIYSICQDVETRNLHGCQVIDLLSHIQSGNPFINQPIQHMLYRVRAVFLKQCLAWMVYGQLDDPGGEFFVQVRSNPGGASGASGDNIYDQVRHRLGLAVQQAESITAGSHQLAGKDSQFRKIAALPFDWISTFILRLELLPESHISPRMASKILFAGKAAKLLHSAGAGLDGSELGGGAYTYLSRGIDNIANVSMSSPNQQPLCPENSSETTDPILMYAKSCGYSQEDLDRYSSKLSSILAQPEHTAELLESLVEDVYSTVSNGIWRLLRDKYKFSSFLQAIRNTYLLGKGELFQLILDGVASKTALPPLESRKANVVLNWDVVRHAAKLLSLDDDAFSGIFSLRVNSAVVAIDYRRRTNNHAASSSTDAGSITSSSGGSNKGSCVPLYVDQNIDGGVCSAGSAREYNNHSLAAHLDTFYSPEIAPRYTLYTTESLISDAAVDIANHWNHIMQRDDIKDKAAPMCPAPGVSEVHLKNRTWFDADIESYENHAEKGTEKSNNQTGKRKPVHKNDREMNSPVYAVGALWIADQKYLVKGFTVQTAFMCDFSAARQFLSTSHPWFSPVPTTASSQSPRHSFASLGSLSTIHSSNTRSADTGLKGPDSMGSIENSVVLGSIVCSIHSDRSGTKTLGTGALGCDISSSLAVGVSFHAVLVHGAVKYAARVFLAAKNENRLRGTGKSGFSISSSVNIAAGGALDNAAHNTASPSDMTVLAEVWVPVDWSEPTPTTSSPHTGSPNPLRSNSLFTLEVDYSRELTHSVNTAASVPTVVAGAVQYRIKARVRNVGNSESPSDKSSIMSSIATPYTGSKNPNFGMFSNSKSTVWDISCLLDLSHYVKMQGGYATIGLAGSGVVLETPRQPSAPSLLKSLFKIDVYSMNFQGRGTLATYPVASPSTATRYPDTFLRLETEVGQIRAWLGIHLKFKFPVVFGIVFDSEALAGYERLYSFIMKVRVKLGLFSHVSFPISPRTLLIPCLPTSLYLRFD